MIKYVGPVVIYNIMDPHKYLLMTLDGKILRGLFKHERLKPAMLRTSKVKINNLSQLKQVINVGLLTSFDRKYFRISLFNSPYSFYRKFINLYSDIQG